MDTTPKKSKHVGKKILFSIIIALSVLVVLLSLGAIIGGWALESRAEKAALAGLKIVENTAGVVRGAIGKVEQPLQALQAKNTDIADASQKLSQNISNKGLVLTLLPEQKEQDLMAAADSVGNTLGNMKDTISNGLDMYRTLDKLPFINLPSLSSDQMSKIDEEVAKVQALADSLRSDVRDARSGTAGKIDQVTILSGILGDTIGGLSDRLAKTDAKLASLQALSIHLQQVVPTAFMVIAIIMTLLLAFVIYTQIEVIRLFVLRWKRLGEVKNPVTTTTTETPAA